MSRRKQPESSFIYSQIKQNIYDYLLEFVDINNKIREEYLWPPHIFDFLTRQTLTEQELVKYNQDLAKKKDEYIKKAKKKPLKRKNKINLK